MVKKLCGIHQGSFTPGLPRKIWPSLNLKHSKPRQIQRTTPWHFQGKTGGEGWKKRMYKQFKDAVRKKIWKYGSSTQETVLKKALRKQKTVFNNNAPISKLWWMPQIFCRTRNMFCSMSQPQPGWAQLAWGIPMSFYYKNTRWQDDG